MYPELIFMILEGLHNNKMYSNIGRVTFERNFDVTIERAVRVACSETWNIGTNSASALGLRKTLIDLAGRRIFRMQIDF
jgi:hypothetical protein